MADHAVATAGEFEAVRRADGESRSIAASLPRLVLEARKIANNVIHGLHGRRRAGAGESFWQYRRFTSGEPSQNIGKSFIKSYAAVCLEGAIIVLACIIFSVFASSPPVVDPDAAPASMVWSYIGELIFNMLILVGAVKMADRLVKEMMGI